VSDQLDLGPGGVGEALTGDGLGFEPDLERIASFVIAREELRQG
jgi:hypothetical protein